MRYLSISLLTAMIFYQSLTPANAELEVIEDAEGQQGLTVYRMTVTPAAEPVPALKHRFSIPLHLQKPGNAATHYLRSFGEGGAPQIRWRRMREAHGEEIDLWYSDEMPIKDLPLDQMREVANSFQDYIDNYIDPASRCRQCEWGLEEMDLRGMETIAFLLPDAQESRQISRALSLCTRFAIAEKRYEDAIELLRMNYQLGQDFSKQRFLVCGLVGLAEVRIANSTLLDLIAAPESPNLYWAISELPRPIIDMREALNLEMSMALRMFPALLDVEKKKHAPEEWSRLAATTLSELQSAGDLLGDMGVYKDETFGQLGAVGLSLVIYPKAKQRLIEAGDDPEKVARMPVAHVLMIDTAREYQKLADEMEKWFYVPYQDMRAVGFGKHSMSDGFGTMLANLLLPAVQAARSAQVRTVWQMDAIRTVEALRMHIAETGKLPATLDEITVIPVPKNPVTEKSFLYRLDGETAVLELPFSDGMPGTAWRFEIQIAK